MWSGLFNLAKRLHAGEIARMWDALRSGEFPSANENRRAISGTKVKRAYNELEDRNPISRWRDI